MKFIVLFEDNTGVGSDVRKTLMPEHLQFLRNHTDSISVAGPLSEPDGTEAGGLWLVEANDELEVTTLIETDPFWPTGLRKSFRILRWTQVFSNGEVLILL